MARTTISQGEKEMIDYDIQYEWKSHTRFSGRKNEICKVNGIRIGSIIINPDGTVESYTSNFDLPDHTNPRVVKFPSEPELARGAIMFDFAKWLNGVVSK